jgi:hypothetical protein
MSEPNGVIIVKSGRAADLVRSGEGSHEVFDFKSFKRRKFLSNESQQMKLYRQINQSLCALDKSSNKSRDTLALRIRMNTEMINGTKGGRSVPQSSCRDDVRLDY